MGKSGLEEQIRKSPAFRNVLAGSIEFENESYNFQRNRNIFVRTLKAIGHYLNPLNYFK